MPSSSSKVVRKRQPKPDGAQQLVEPMPSAQNAPSPVISDGITTEADLCAWAGWFGRFHTDPMPLYIPIAVRTIDCDVLVRRAAQNPSPRFLRCVREVAKSHHATGIEWKLITWVPGLPGMQIASCASLEDAMAQFDAPPLSLLF